MSRHLLPDRYVIDTCIDLCSLCVCSFPLGTAFFFFFSNFNFNFNPSSPLNSIVPTLSTSCLQPIHSGYHLPVIAIANITLANSSFLPHSAIDPVRSTRAVQLHSECYRRVRLRRFVTMKLTHPSASCFPRMITTGSPYVGV